MCWVSHSPRVLHAHTHAQTYIRQKPKTKLRILQIEDEYTYANVRIGTIKRRWCTGFGNRELRLTNVTTVMFAACRYNVLCWLLPCRTVGVLWWLRNPLAVNMPDETHSTIKMWESIADETENHYIIQTTNVPLISWGVCVGGDAWLCVSKSISPFTQSTSGEKLDKWFDYTWCAGGCVRGLFFRCSISTIE